MTTTRERTRTAAPAAEQGQAADTVMTGQQWMAEWIRRSGMNGFFFMPTFLYPTMIDLADDGLKRVLGHSEKAMAYMADGCAQASGRPGLVITQGGPGACNLLSGLGDAWQAGTPIIAMTTYIPTARYRGNSYQEVYVDFGTVTKYDAEVRDLSRLPDLLGEAYREATTGATRPVHLYLDGSIETASLNASNMNFLDERYFTYPAFRPRADDADVAQAVAELRAAERPMIVCGRGAISSGAWEEVTALAERLQIPVTASLGGKGSIDESHPLSLGVEGSYRRASTMDMLEESDVALFVGSHVGGATTLLGTIPPPTSRIIHIDIDPAQPGKNVPNTLPLFGDARTVLQQMLDVTGPGDPGANQVWVKRCQEARAAWWKEHDEDVLEDKIPIRPERLAVEVAKALPDNAIITADTGYAAAWAGAYMDLPAGKNFLACEGTLGWAFPAAIGAKVGAPERPVVAWTGDGGFMYHMAEIETAVRNDINAIAIVLNNHALVFDTHLLQAFWSASHDVDLLSEYKETNFANIAKELGGNGIRVTDPTKIGDAVDQALHNDKLTVIDVVIDHAAVAPVAFMAGQGSRSGMLSEPEKMK